MKKTFENLVQKMNEHSLLIEDMLKLLALNPKARKLKTKLEKAHKDMQRALQAHSDLVTDVIPEISVDVKKYPEAFQQAWSDYKDYMVEQHGIRMNSRMQFYRLSLLVEITNKDLERAAKWLKYYMSSGSQNIFPVKEYELIEYENNESAKKPGFSFPKRKK